MVGEISLGTLFKLIGPVVPYQLDSLYFYDGVCLHRRAQSNSVSSSRVLGESSKHALRLRMLGERKGFA